MNHKGWLFVGLLILLMVAYMLFPFASIIVYSIFIYYLARPAYSRLFQHVKSESLCAFAALILLALPVVMVLAYTLGVASIEISNLMTSGGLPHLQSIDGLVNETNKFLGDIKPDDIAKFLSAPKGTKGSVIETLLGEASSFAWNAVSSMLQFILALFMVFIVSFYLLSDGSRLRIWFKKTFFRDGKTFDAFFNEVDKDLSDVYIGNILTAGVIAVLGSLVFTIANAVTGSISIPHPKLLGLLCGVTSLIPIAGVALVWAPLIVYLILNASAQGAFAQSLPAIALFFLATFIIVDWLPNMLLRPRMSSQKLHKGLLLLAYIFGPIVFGLKGLFLGPMILVLAVDFSQIILPKLRKK